MRSVGCSGATVSRSEPLSVQHTALVDNMGMLESKVRAVVAVHQTIMGKSTPSTKAMLQGSMRRGGAVTGAAGGGDAAQAAEGASSSAAPQAGEASRGSILEHAGGAGQGRGEGRYGGAAGSDSEDEVPLTRAQIQARAFFNSSK